MANIVTILVENPDQILNIGHSGANAVVQVQSGATDTGAFADVGTVAIVTAVRSYTFYDNAGSSSTWYRTRYETSGGVSTSDWTPAFQVGPEGAGLICSLDDVKQELGSTSTADDELIIEKIRQVGAEIMLVTGRQFLRTPSSGTTTYLFDVDCMSRELRVPRGISGMTTLEVATYDQPDTGGTYTTVSTTQWSLRPVPAEREYGWPATTILLLRTSSSMFYQGYNTVRVTGALGWDTVPYDIQAIALRAVTASFLSKGSGAGGVVAAGPTGAMMVLRFISPHDAETLQRYAVIP